MASGLALTGFGFFCSVGSTMAAKIAPISNVSMHSFDINQDVLNQEPLPSPISRYLVDSCMQGCTQELDVCMTSAASVEFEETKCQ